MLECIHGNTGYSKTEQYKFQDIPKVIEVATSLFLHFLNTADEEIEGETTVQDFKENDNNSKSTHVTLESKYLYEIKK